MALAAANLTEHLMRAAAATQGYMGHQLRTFQIMRGAWIASVDGYEPGMTGVEGLVGKGESQAEALDDLMNEMDRVQAEFEDDEDEDCDVESAKFYGIRDGEI